MGRRHPNQNEPAFVQDNPLGASPALTGKKTQNQPDRRKPKRGVGGFVLVLIILASSGLAGFVGYYTQVFLNDLFIRTFGITEEPKPHPPPPKPELNLN